MKITLFKRLLLFGAFLCFSAVSAQTVSGTVTDSSGPLPGANVLVKGTEYLNPEFVGDGWNITGVQNTSGRKFVIGGKRLYGTSCFNLSATGGPENPENNTYTLNVEIAPAFASMVFCTPTPDSPYVSVSI